ncbi:MAG: 3'-5' exonuclease [Bacteroidales bacterium]|nr:3'-5' exonuclease [Bacteroidales bacterium]
MNLNLKRPFVVFDLETTGVQVGADHIVQMCFLKVLPSGDTEERTYLVRPADREGNTLHIPEETTAIHGISDTMVAHERTFAEIAPELADFIGDADLGGYNSNKFDVPMLVEEFLRANHPFSLKGRFLVDVQNIFHKMEQRTLKAAYHFYCNKELENAHSADADTRATFEVLKAQLDKYQGVPFIERNGSSSFVENDIESLSRFSTLTPNADLVGHMHFDHQHREVFSFGKHKGQVVEEVFQKEPAYYDWIMKADFPLSTKQLCTDIYQRIRQNKLEQLKQKFQS